METRYRVRKNWLGQCVLQVWVSKYDGLEVTAEWQDVKYDHVPMWFLDFNPEKA